MWHCLHHQAVDEWFMELQRFSVSFIYCNKERELRDVSLCISCNFRVIDTPTVLPRTSLSFPPAPSPVAHTLVYSKVPFFVSLDTLLDWTPHCLLWYSKTFTCVCPRYLRSVWLATTFTFWVTPVKGCPFHRACSCIWLGNPIWSHVFIQARKSTYTYWRV